jgi:hypothetical protein
MAYKILGNQSHSLMSDLFADKHETMTLPRSRDHGNSRVGRRSWGRLVRHDLRGPTLGNLEAKLQ